MNDSLKMNIIITIQMLNSCLGHTVDFDALWSEDYETLELMRDRLLDKYNKSVEDKRFAADMIYGRSKK